MSAKTHEHRIRNISENQFEAFINYLNWEVSPPRHDYGVDYWGEVFANGDPTGDIFRVQLKGTETIATYTLKTQNHLYYDVPIVRLREWLNNPVPVYFILWDIGHSVGYWLHIQNHIHEKLEKHPEWLDQEKKGQTRRIHIPAMNVIQVGHSTEFENDLARHIAKIRDGKEVNAWIETIRGISWSDMREQLRQIQNMEDIEYVVHSERLVAIEIALKAQPQNVDLWTERAELQYEQLQFGLAVEAINQAYKLDPSSHKVLSLRGCILCDYARNQNDEPKHLFVEAIENFQQSSSSITAASYHYNIGNCYAGLGNHQKAVEEYDLALADAPPPEFAALIWKNRGTSFFNLGDHDEEKSNYLNAIELAPDLWEAYFSMATTLVHFHDYEAAEAVMEKGIEFVPKHPRLQASANYLLAYTKWKLEKDTEALPLVNQVLETLPHNKNAYYLKAHVLMALWRQDNSYIEDAKRFFGTWVLADPTIVLAKGELHLIYKASGELEQARKVITEALADSDDVPAMMFYDYAMMLKEDGKIDEAIENLHKAASIEVNHAIEHQLGHLYLAKEDYPAALHWYRQAQASSTDVEHMLRDIAMCQFYLSDYKECAISLMEQLLFDPYRQDTWTNLATSMFHLRLRSAYEAIAPEIDKVHTPEQLATVFDGIVGQLFPERNQDWLYFQPRPAHDDEGEQNEDYV